MLNEYSLTGFSSEKIIEALNAQRADSRLCDVVLRAENELFPAHRCVLAAASQYFESMFEENHFSEGKDKEVELHSISPKALKAILDAIYTGSLKLDTDVMYSVLSGADHYLMTEVKYTCAEFMLHVLKSERSTDEALRIRRSAELFSLTDLQHEADRVIASSFASVARSAAFLESNLEEVLSLLSSDYIHESNEYVFYFAAIAWIKHDLSGREQHLDVILPCLRFPLIESHLLLGSVQKEPLIQKSALCQQFIEEAKKYQLLGRSQSTMQTDRTRPRCTSRDTVVYCLSAAGHFKCYIPRYDRWYSLPAFHALPDDGQDQEAASEAAGGASPRPLTRHSLVVVSGVVYLCSRAARRTDEHGSHMEIVQLQRFSLESNAWKLCSLPSKVCVLPMVQVDVPTFVMECNNTLYACSRNAVERYHSEIDSWEVVSVSHLSPCQFAVSDDNKIYMYAMEDGISQELCMDSPSLVNTRQVMSPNRFVVEVLGATKLPNHEVLLSLRMMSGISRKIFNVQSNLWRDGNIFYGHSSVQPRPGQHYPACFDTSDMWEILCNRNDQVFYVLSTRSGLTDIPPHRPKQVPTRSRSDVGYSDSSGSDESKGGSKKLDAVLPFYRLDFTDKRWTRLASLPEFMAGGQIEMCISDGQSSMGNSNVM